MYPYSSNKFDVQQEWHGLRCFEMWLVIYSTPIQQELSIVIQKREVEHSLDSHLLYSMHSLTHFHLEDTDLAHFHIAKTASRRMWSFALINGTMESETLPLQSTDNRLCPLHHGVPTVGLFMAILTKQHWFNFPTTKTQGVRFCLKRKSQN